MICRRFRKPIQAPGISGYSADAPLRMQPERDVIVLVLPALRRIKAQRLNGARLPSQVYRVHAATHASEEK
jgi:hypothetical protein